MKAYVVLVDGCYWLVNAPTAARAKGIVIAMWPWDFGRLNFAGIRCRRWPAFDSADAEPKATYWGYPGERSDATGGQRIEVPEPFRRVES